MMILLIVLFVIPLLWVIGFLLATDFAVPLKDARQFRRILVIFPHADDEAISCGGFLHRISRRGCEVTLAILTRGERGIPSTSGNGSLVDIRVREAQAVSAILGISKLIQEDLGDGALHDKRQKLTTFIALLIEQEKPDLLITYDLAGLYGHTDHITCSEIITELKRASFPELPLWYVTFPPKMLARVKPPDDMTVDVLFREKQAFPTHKVFIGASVFPKIKAWYTYQSQLSSLTKGIAKFVPIWSLWFPLSLMLFEYFAEAN
jgi:LmbE family N-acetylglucosaminyl deacetylase